MSIYPDPQIGNDFVFYAQQIERHYDAVLDGAPLASFNAELVLFCAETLCLEVPLYEPVHSLTEGVVLGQFQIAYRKLRDLCQRFHRGVEFAELEAVMSEWDAACEAVAKAFPRREP